MAGIYHSFELLFAEMWFETKIPPDEEPSTLDVYLRYTILNVHGLIGTAIFAVLAAAAGFAFSGLTQVISVSLLILVGVVLVWIAGFMLWKAERDNLSTTQAKFDNDRDDLRGQLTLTRPKLVGRILYFQSGEWRGRRLKDGPVDEHLGTRINVYLSLWSESPIETQIIQFKLKIEHDGKTYEEIGLPIKDGILERKNPRKDLVGFLSNESTKIQNGDYFEGQAEFKMRDYFADNGFNFDATYQVIVVDSYQQQHAITIYGQGTHTRSTHKQ